MHTNTELRHFLERKKMKIEKEIEEEREGNGWKEGNSFCQSYRSIIKSRGSLWISRQSRNRPCAIAFTVMRVPKFTLNTATVRKGMQYGDKKSLLRLLKTLNVS